MLKAKLHTWKKPADPITDRNSIFGVAMDKTVKKCLKIWSGDVQYKLDHRRRNALFPV